MEYLDRNKVIRQQVLLWLGYTLVAVAIVTATLVLVYQAYGFNLGKNNTVIQNGLVFLSSQPNPANIYLDNVLRSEQTNTRLIIPSGVYRVRLSRSGYRDWSRTIEVSGGNVEHFDYPLLIPSKLAPIHINTYASAPPLLTESLDRRWLLVEKPASITDFDLYDFKTPARAVTSSISLPTGLLTKAVGAESLKLISWADDNQHVLLQHIYDGKSEYILLDRANPAQSVNLNTSFNTSFSDLTLSNKKYNLYMSLDSTTGDLKQYSLGTAAGQLIASHVLQYKTYGSSTILYVTNERAAKGKVLVKILSGGNEYTVKSLPLSSSYLLDLTTYSGTLYVAAGSSSANRVYIYADPVGQLSNLPNQAPVPVWVLHVDGVSSLSFSNSAQFITAENGNTFAVYDIQNNLGYSYNTDLNPLDPPQSQANWMDGDRLIYVSGGKITIFDYDHQNIQQLIAASPNYIPAFSSDYKYLIALSPNASGQIDLNETPLLKPGDL